MKRKKRSWLLYCIESSTLINRLFEKKEGCTWWHVHELSNEFQLIGMISINGIEVFYILLIGCNSFLEVKRGKIRKIRMFSNALMKKAK